MRRKIVEKVSGGVRLAPEEALWLFGCDDIFLLGGLASAALRRKDRSNRVYYVRNVHVNPTNICVNRCRFCAFSRSKGEEGAYELTIEDVVEKLRSAPSFDEVHIVGGLHPDWPLEHYLELLRAIKSGFPSCRIKAFTAAEIDYMQRTSGLSLEEVIGALRKSGLDLLPGGGAEIFDPVVRGNLCPEKISGGRWLEVMRAVHREGLKSNATMLYGHVETHGHRVDHLLKIRSLQDEAMARGAARGSAGGFQAFIPLPYQPKTEIGGARPSGIEDLKCIAVSRLFLDNIPHIKAYWVMLGEKLSQVALLFGADDLEGTVVEEKIAHSAGALSKEAMTEEELRYIIEKAGKVPVRRDSFYGVIG
jgi:aminodeoxyfutalosine synthase